MNETDKETLSEREQQLIEEIRLLQWELEILTEKISRLTKP